MPWQTRGRCEAARHSAAVTAVQLPQRRPAVTAGGSLHHQQGEGEPALAGGERTRSRGRALHQLSGGTFWQQNHCASDSVIAQMVSAADAEVNAFSFLENCSIIKSD